MASSSVERIPPGGYELWGDHECRRGLDSYKTVEMGEASVLVDHRMAQPVIPVFTGAAPIRHELEAMTQVKSIVMPDTELYCAGFDDRGRTMERLLERIDLYANSCVASCSAGAPTAVTWPRSTAIFSTSSWPPKVAAERRGK